MTTNATIANCGFSFPPGTRVIPGTGQDDDELWVLLNPDEEKPDGWNYWMIMDCPDNVRPWKLREIFRHWGRYSPHPEMVIYIGEPLPHPTGAGLTYWRDLVYGSFAEILWNEGVYSVRPTPCVDIIDIHDSATLVRVGVVWKRMQDLHIAASYIAAGRGGAWLRACPPPCPWYLKAGPRHAPDMPPSNLGHEGPSGNPTGNTEIFKVFCTCALPSYTRRLHTHPRKQICHRCSSNAPPHIPNVTALFDPLAWSPLFESHATPWAATPSPPFPTSPRTQWSHPRTQSRNINEMAVPVASSRFIWKLQVEQMWHHT